MANSDLNNIHAVKFTEMVELLAQQEQPLVASQVSHMDAYGEKAQSTINLSPVDPSELAAPSYAGGAYDGWYGDTEWDNIEHTQRWALPTKYKTALPMHEGDLERMLADPRSQYARSIVAGINRTRDTIVMAAATGTVKQGPYSAMTNAALPAGNIIPADGGSGAESPLTVEKLIDMRTILAKNEAWGYEKPMIVVTPDNIRSLLNDPTLTSADYNTVKALVNGNVDSFMGFTFIESNFVPNDGNATPAEFKLYDTFAFLPSGVVEATWQDLKIRIDERPDKNYTWQIYATMTCGATRNQDQKVVVAKTSGPTANP